MKCNKFYQIHYFIKIQKIKLTGYGTAFETSKPGVINNGPRSPKWTRGKRRGESLTNCLPSFLADLTHVDDVYHIYYWAVIPVIRRFGDGGFSHRFTFYHLNMEKKIDYLTSIRAKTGEKYHNSYQFCTFQSSNFFVMVAINRNQRLRSQFCNTSFPSS